MQQTAPIPNSADELLSRMLQSDPDGPEPQARLGTKGDSIDGRVPTVVAVPRTIEQVAAAVRFASSRSMAIVPVGGKTQSHRAGVLRRCDLLLDLSEMNRIVEYQPDNMTVTVEAGCTFKELQKRLAAHGQFLPIDPAVSAEATLGGLVATRATGPSRQGYGTIRDYLLGATLVTANGDIVQSGTRVVKSAAGYEVHKLLIGSHGTLGVITELTFMVRPLPRDRRMLFLPLPHPAGVEPLLAALLDAGLELQLLELLNSAALTRFARDLLPASAEDTPYALFLGLVGSSASVAWQVDHIMHVTASLPKREEGFTVHSLPWEAAYEALLALRRFPADAVVCRVSLLGSQLSFFIEQAEEILARYRVEAPLLAHAGCGIVHIPLSSGSEQVTSLVEELREVASRLPFAPEVPQISEHPQMHDGPSLLERPGLGDLGALRRLRSGRLVVESAPTSLRERLSVWGERAEEHELSSALRAKLDPRGLLNPGRM